MSEVVCFRFYVYVVSVCGVVFEGVYASLCLSFLMRSFIIE